MNHNPVAFLARLPAERLESKAVELALGARITQAFHLLRDYLEARNTWGDRYAGPLKARPVAYFSAEFGLHESLPIYSGGLGVLAGDHLKSASDLGVPIVGVGLFYAEGYFDQRLDAEGRQHEEYATTDVEQLPLDLATDGEGNPLLVGVPVGKGEMKVRVWAAHVGRGRLLLLDSNVEANSEEERGLTGQLYGGDAGVRIRQEVVLGIGGMRALAAMGERPGVLHLNEGHSAFAVLEHARMMMEREGRGFGDVRERVAARTVFTTHTPVEAGHDRFEPSLVREVLGPYREGLGLEEKAFMALGRIDPQDEEEPFCMTVLGLKMARRRNGVSAVHGSVSRAMWRKLWPDRAEDGVPIGHITNGVHVASWLAQPMAALYERDPGLDWQDRACDPATWAAVDDIDREEFWQQHQIQKARLIDFILRRLRAQAERRGEEDGEGEACVQTLDPEILTIGFARRFAPYKRADLLLGDMDRLDALVNHPERPVQIIFAGKAHPGDRQGKDLVQKVFRATRDARFRGRLVFLENHDINVGRHLVQGVDVWLNNPRRPLEACGTSGQKVILNGGMNVSTLDGWWAEAYDGTNGFAVGDGREHADPDRQEEFDRVALYDVLEKELVPLFYERDPDHNGLPVAWIERQRNSIRTLAWRFGARRMMIDYVMRCYLPAVGAATTAFPGDGIDVRCPSG